MAFRAIGVAVLLSTVPAAGCGTVANLTRPGPEEGGKVPFGGVRHDLRSIHKAADDEVRVGARAEPGAEPDRRTVLAAVCAADLPFSLIGDLVTWPYTASYTCINRPVPVPPTTLAPPEAGPMTPP